jgi:zinc finger protein 362/384
MIDDGRMDHHAIQGGAQMTPASIYGAAGALRSGSSNSSSPGGIHGGVHHGHHGPGSALLVVPQPINATKMGAGLTNGTGRKYQCKMCPQVRSVSWFSFLIFIIHLCRLLLFVTFEENIGPQFEFYLIF